MAADAPIRTRARARPPMRFPSGPDAAKDVESQWGLAWGEWLQKQRWCPAESASSPFEISIGRCIPHVTPDLIWIDLDVRKSKPAPELLVSLPKPRALSGRMLGIFQPDQN